MSNNTNYLTNKKMSNQQIMERINNYRKSNNYNLDSLVYPYYSSFIDFIKQTRHIKYISNISFYTLIFAYLTKIDFLVRILIPINITNCIIIILIILFEFKNLYYYTLGNKNFHKIPIERRKQIIDNDKSMEKIAITLIILYHIFIIIITLIINHYHVNNDYSFLFLFACAITFISGFLVISQKYLYGQIKESFYIATYIFILFTLNYLLNNKQQY